MAGEAGQRRRRSEKYAQVPDRVEEAAGRMAMGGSSSNQQGSMPGFGNTGGFPRAMGYTDPGMTGSRQALAGQGMTGTQQRVYAQNTEGGYGAQGGYPGQEGYGAQGGYPAQNGYPAQGGYPGQEGYPAQNGYGAQGGYPGPEGYQGQSGYGAQGAYPGQNGYGGQPGSGSAGQTNSSRAWTGREQKFQTAANGRVNDFRGYVAMGGGDAAPQPETPRKKRSVMPIIAAVLAVLILGAGGAFAAMSYSKTKRINDRVAPYDNLFVNGVYVDGIHLGGMTPEQALNSVQSQIQQRSAAWSVTLTYGGEVQAVINAGMLGMSVDIGEVMNNAWLQGHEGDYEQRYAAMDALEETPYEAYTATPSGDTSVIDNVMAQIKDRIDLAPVNAEVTAFDTTLPYPFTFSDERIGRRLDTAPVVEKIYQMVSTLQSGEIELEPESIQPRVTKIDLQKHYMLRSSVYTPISTSSTEERNKNIARALEKINGTIVNPGTNFSFNNVVGERTEENGFFPAIEYAYNEHVMGIGGGVCQASTTIYQAAVCAGLQIVKREPHSDAVNYTEYGKDATVSWMYNRKVDFVFKNNTTEPIYIVSAVQTDPSNKRRLIAKVSIYGEDMGDVRYELESEIVEELPPPVNPEYVKDKQGTYVTYTDQEQSVRKAKPGYVVKSYRVEYTANVMTARKDLYRDVYQPQAERIYVGVKKRETN